MAAVGPLVGRMADRIATMELSRFWKLRNALFALRKRLGFSPVGAMPPFALDPVDRSIVAAGGAYGQWLQRHATRASDVERLREASEVLASRPVVSIVLTTYDPDPAHLRAALDSVFAQAYPYWQLCVADDASTDPKIVPILAEYAARDDRMCYVVRPSNGHISRAANSALELATGEYVGFLDHDDVLTPDACFEIALRANRFPDADMFYSDEDKIDETGTLRDPYFKPDWSPDSLLSRMYVGHFTAYRRSLVEELGGFRPDFDGSQDYDLALRLTERTTRVEHIPRVLYHWRVHDTSTASHAAVKPYAAEAAVRAIGEAIERRGEPGTVSPVAGRDGVYVVRYRIRTPGKISIVLPTRDHADDVDRCLGSLFARTTYADFEVLLVDNGSTDARARATFDAWASRDERVRLLRYDVPFNYARINNWAVARATGSYVVLLNNDTEILTPDWLEAMLEQAQRPAIGAVGALLLYDDDTVQHAGVIIGINGVAGHGQKHYPRDGPGYFQTLASVNNYSAVTAACLMVRKALYDELGGLEEELAIAFNDVDFCLKAGRAGYRNVWLPHVILRHAESKSRGFDTTFSRRQILYREEHFMKRRWGTDVRPDPYYSPNLTLRAEDYALRIDEPAR